MAAIKVIQLILLVAAFGHAQDSSLYQCQPSSQNSEQVFIPNIPDFYFNHSKAAAFRVGGDRKLTATGRKGRTYIFMVPSCSEERNCSGNISHIEYCYQVKDEEDLGSMRDIFDFITVERNGLHFTVLMRDAVTTTPEESTCTDPHGSNMEPDRVCCTKQAFTAQLTTSSFSYGVVVRNNNKYRLLTFSITDFDVERFSIRQHKNGGPKPGAVMSPGSNFDHQNNSLLLLRFFLDAATTKPQETTETGNPLTTEPPEQADTSNVTNTDVTFLSTAYTIPDETTSAPQTTLGNIQSVNPGTIGGAVGGFLAGFFIVVIVVVAMVTSVRRCRRKSAGMSESNGIAIANATYVGVTSGTDGEASSQGIHYAGKGPHSCCEVDTKSAVPVYETSGEYAYAYAETGACDLSNSSYDKLTFGVTKTKTGDEEDIYMVPALDVEGLYSQLSDIKTQTLARKSIGLGMQLGNGQFGTVFKGVWYSSNGKKIDVAVKTLKEGSGEQDRVKFLQEAAIMGQFRHPNVVTMYGVVSEGEPVLLVLELLCKGDLRGYLLNMRTDEEGGEVSVSEHTLLSYCRQVASGMTYLSSKAFVHRDLAARNILISDDEICKIADFGMSRDLMDENYYVSHGGKIPVKWTAPEALHYKKYSTASDVWSYGALMYEIWSVGHKPFENRTNPKALELIDTGYRLPPPPGCPRALYSIMISCWNPVPSERPGFTEVSRELSLPDSKLLKWSEEDKRVHPEVAKLGADLLCAGELYRDLQARYIQV